MVASVCRPRRWMEPMGTTIGARIFCLAPRCSIAVRTCYTCYGFYAVGGTVWVPFHPYFTYFLPWSCGGHILASKDSLDCFRRRCICIWRSRVDGNRASNVEYRLGNPRGKPSLPSSSARFSAMALNISSLGRKPCNSAHLSGASSIAGVSTFVISGRSVFLHCGCRGCPLEYHIFDQGVQRKYPFLLTPALNTQLMPWPTILSHALLVLLRF